MEFTKIQINEILQGDTLTVLKTLPGDSVDTIITSPPYWGLRDYGFDEQIGLEPTLEEFIDKMSSITGQLKRVLKPSGVMWWNHGDCYGGIKEGKTDRMVADYVKDTQKSLKKYAPKHEKCLMLQNYRLILRMIDEQGWILRNTIVWHKPNGMPSSVKDRLGNKYEPVFMLVKNKKYWFDLDAIREPHKEISLKRLERAVSNKHKHSEGCPGQSMQGLYKPRASRKHFDNPEKYGSPRARDFRNKNKGIGAMQPNKFEGGDYMVGELDPAGKNPGDVWAIPTQPLSEAHFATFPEKLIEPMIKASCPQWICRECGEARARISRVDYEDAGGRGLEKYGDNSPEDGSNPGPQGMKHGRANAIRQTIGWTRCQCKNPQYRAGIVLDPFIGSGTTGLVARKCGRDYIGIELKQEYIDIARRRLQQEHLF